MNNNRLPSLKPKFPRLKIQLPKLLAGLAVVGIVAFAGWAWIQDYQKFRQAEAEKQKIALILESTQQTLDQVQQELEELKNSDPYKTNRDLQAKIKLIEKTYTDSVKIYEEINDFENSDYPEKQIEELRKLFALTINQLAEQNYDGAVKSLADIKTKATEFLNQRTAELLAAAKKEAEKQAAQTTTSTGQTSTTGQTTTTPVVSSAGVINEPPSNGYRRQVVQSDAGQFTVSIVAGDLNSTRAIVDTASTSTCANDCPVLPLADYVSRNGAYAGINGTYFCPASYPSCAGKTNSFDLLVMNKDKTYFNSDNNVYSTNPGVIFQSGSMRFVGQMSQWGRDTGVDGVLSNYPLLVSGGNVVFGGDDDPKKGSAGNRSFVANRGSTAYIGVVHSATVAQSARVMKAMGMDNALNLDDGGSTALYFGGYKVGPGRALPNVILFKVK